MNIETHFHLPIYYNNQKKQLQTNIITDLELIQTLDGSNNPIYSHFFHLEDGKKDFAQSIMKQTANYYTTDVEFLKETQQLLTTYNTPQNQNNIKINDFEEIKKLWDDIKNDTGFKEKYYYIDWPMWEFLNKSEAFLQCMSIYNMASPVISLLLPVLMLIVPFFIIQIKGLHLTVEEYIEVLKIIVSQHALGKLFSEFHEVSLNQKFYLFISAAFYVFSIYQNILLCIRFHSNMTKIHEYFKTIDAYLDYTIETMSHYLHHSENLKTYTEFNVLLNQRINSLQELRKKISYISDYKLSFQKMLEIGYILKYFYEIYENPLYEEAFLYSFGFHGYIDCLEGIVHHLENKKIHFIEFIDCTETKKKSKQNKKQTTVFKNSYYAALKDSKPVKNTVKLNKNLIITGPNASGKTTVLKSTLINLILSQQFGCGFYQSGSKIKPYDHLHCYLNIPDTSGRDSLFQAEARRCKEIIDFIQETPEESHFCIFDELYSGTNPEEAEVSAISFMDYLVKRKNVSTLLTTHYINVCTQLEKNKEIMNYHMKVDKNDSNDFQYTYVISKGISKMKGGIKVLKDMNYPQEILEKMIR